MTPQSGQATFVLYAFSPEPPIRLTVRDRLRVAGPAGSILNGNLMRQLGHTASPVPGRLVREVLRAVNSYPQRGQKTSTACSYIPVSWL